MVDAARGAFGGLDATVPFYSLETYDQTLPLHLGRTVTLVNYRDEFDFGLRAEPYKGIPALADFRQRWEKDERAYAFMLVRRFEEEARAGTPMQIIARDSRYVLVRKPAVALK